MRKYSLFITIAIVAILLGGNFYLSNLHEKYINNIFENEKNNYDELKISGFFFWNKEFVLKNWGLFDIKYGDFYGNSNIWQGKLGIYTKGGAQISNHNVTIAIDNQKWELYTRKKGFDLLFSAASIDPRDIVKSYDRFESKASNISLSFMGFANLMRLQEVEMIYIMLQPKDGKSAINMLFNLNELEYNDNIATIAQPFIGDENKQEFEAFKNILAYKMSLKADLQFSSPEKINSESLDEIKINNSWEVYINELKFMVGEYNVKILGNIINNKGNFNGTLKVSQFFPTTMKDKIINLLKKDDIANYLKVEEYLKELTNSQGDELIEIQVDVKDNDITINNRPFDTVVKDLMQIYDGNQANKSADQEALQIT